MSDLEKEQLPQSAIEILRHVGEIIGQVNPELLKVLGSIATIGIEGEEQDFVHLLNDTAQEVQDRLDEIFTAISGVPTVLSPPKIDIVVEQPDTPADVVLVPVDEPEAIETVQPKEYSLLDTLSITPNERAAVNLTIGFLKKSGGRENLRNITQAAFGVRLQKNEEQRLAAILDACAELGLIEKYGKTYSSTKNVEEIISEPLSQFDHDLLEYLKTTIAGERSGLLNIGQIVRQFFGVQELDRQSFRDFIDQINRLASLGYVTHPESAWYGLGDIKVKAELDNTVMSIATAAIGFDPKAALVAAKAAEAELPGEETTGPAAKPEVKAAVELDSLDVEILEFCQKSGLKRVEELHREIPGLTEMSEEEYSKFKIDFPQIRQKIIEHFAAKGIEAKWEESGQRRGKKYRLVISDQSLVIPKAKKRIRKHDRITGFRPTKTDEPEEPETKQTVLENRRTLRHAAHFTLKLTETIADNIGHQPGGAARISTVSKDVAALLGLPRPEAREMVRDLIRKRHLFFVGSEKGHWLLSAQQPAEDFRPRRNRGDQGNGGETQNQWTTEEVNLAIRILDRISAVRYFQQGLQVKDLARQLDVREDQLRPLLRQMHNKKYLLFEHKARATRGGPKSRRTSIMLARFETQDAKNHYRDAREEVVAEIRSLVGVAK